MERQFVKLNSGWNAEPNSPEPVVERIGSVIELRFFVNAFISRDVAEGDVGCLRFTQCSRYRLGPTNDEGWYHGQCRYTDIAPEWGRFYEVCGHDPLRDRPADWRRLTDDAPEGRHFLFYLKDETFECLAEDWSYIVRAGPSQCP